MSMRKLVVVAFLMVFAVGFGACGGGSGGGPDATDTTDPDSTGATGTKAASQGRDGCLADSDCSLGTYCFQDHCAFDCSADEDCTSDNECSPRGKCVVPIPADVSRREIAVLEETLVETTLDRSSTPIAIEFAPGDESVEIPVNFNGVLPDAGVAYRVEFLDCAQSTLDVVQAQGFGASTQGCVQSTSRDRQRVERFTSNQNILQLAIPDTAADRSILVRIITAAGTMSTELRSSRPFSGRYVGTGRVDAFGGARLPIEFEIATRPAEASLANADSVRLRLPIRQDFVFSPMNPFVDDAIEDVVVPMERAQDGSEQWIARVGFNYDVSNSALLSIAESDRVDRFMRIELEAGADGTVSGRIVDRFRGLVQLNLSNDDYSYPFIAIESDIEAIRSGDTTLSVTTPLTAETRATYRPYEADLGVCGGSGAFAACDNIDDGQPEACPGIQSAGEFQSATSVQQIACVERLYECVLEGGTAQSSFIDLWGAALDALDPSGGVDELSEELAAFDELVDSCDGPEIDYDDEDANWEEDTNQSQCRPNLRLACLRSLASSAVANAAGENVDLAPAIRVFAEATSEASFADRMRAFGMDQKIRLRWLLTKESLTEFGDTSNQFLEDEIEYWEENVAATYYDVLASILEPSALSILADSAIASSLETDSMIVILTELTEAWVGSAETLRTSADRWNGILDESGNRSDKARELYGLASDLYLAAGILSKFNLSAGASSEEDGDGANFLNGDFVVLRDVFDAIDQLSQSYNELIFARDAELVLVTTVDPLAGPLTALDGRRTAARDIVGQAASEVEEVLAQAQARAVRIQDIEGQLDEQIEQSFDQMTSICGNRNQCDVEEWLAGGCDVPISLGECGYSSPRNAGEQRTIEDVIGFGSSNGATPSAAKSLLAIEDAGQAAGIAESELASQEAVRDQAMTDFDRLESVVRSWADLRALGLQGTRELVDELATRRQRGEANLRDFYESKGRNLEASQSLAALTREEELATRLERGDISAEEYNAQLAMARNVASQATAANDLWRTFNVSNDSSAANEIAVYYNELSRAQETSKRASEARLNYQTAAGALSATTQFFPVGAFDFSAGVRGTLSVAAVGLEYVGGRKQQEIQGRADRMRIAADRARALSQARRTNEQEVADQASRDARLLDVTNRVDIEQRREAFRLERQTLDNDFASFTDGIEKSREELALEQLEAQGIFEVTETQLRDAIASLEGDERLRQAELRAEEERLRDFDRLESAQSRVLNEAARIESLNLRVLRSEFNIEQAVAEYGSWLRQAESAADRIRRLNRRKNNSLALERSPAVLFRFANDLKRAERKVEDARRAMMDWLVAIEYYSVRPFVDLRRDTLLASSPNQFEDLVNAYERREQTCGAGAPTEEVVTISLRDYVYRIDGPKLDPVTGETLTPAEQFRAYIGDEYIPVDKSIRYAPDTDIGDFQRFQHRLLTSTFVLDVNSFANLRTACNAKIRSVSLNFVGDIQIRPGAVPEFTLIYDGVASLRSCHPNLSEVVQQIGADVTSFGLISTFENSGRAISGLGGVNEFSTTENILLAERPLGAQYTLVISENTETNSDFQLERLEDIVVRIRYSHQATFPSDSECR